ncbi:S9 family peptidase [Aestuariibacter halophilus]|uniref:Acyl-peptide hydrolase n=1 Tax=Fluctibacter halophilus TaxID=226011 RepID=A0ABS8G7E0_9ALTE|nr:S9 family peptidase [Aestuariibacter halophilus]MCC2616438.1 S9 family peptidase [Aestuariibacter halophilus]
MTSSLLTASLLAGIALSSPVLAEQDWPYPQDTPAAQPLSIGYAGQQPSDISRILLSRGAQSAQMGPDGSVIAFTSSVTGSPQLWVKHLKDGRQQQLTFGNGVRNYRWHPDGRHLIYTADNEGNEREAFVMITLDGKHEKPLLPANDSFRALGPVSPDGRYLAYASTERNGRDFDLYLLDLEQGGSKRIYEAEFGYYPVSWRPGSATLLVAEVRGEDANNLYALDTDKGDGTLKTLFKPDVAARYNNIQWQADGTGFYFTTNQDGEMMALAYYDYANSQTATVRSVQHNIEDVQLCQQDRTLMWRENDQGIDRLYIQDQQTRQATPIDTPTGTLSLSCGNTASAAILLRGPDTPGDVYVLNLNDPTPRLVLPSTLAGLSAEQFVFPTVVQFPARDGVMLQGLLYLPETPQGEVPPVVIDIHGGPTAQSKASWQPLTQYLVSRGIAVLDINVRGSTGFGKTYARLDNQTKRLDSVRDLVDALAWLKKDGRVDAQRAAAMGGSYGGYMVNAVMGAYPQAFKAGASFVGVADWVKALQNASPGLKASDRIEYGDIREPRWQAFYAANSPINTVNNIIAPMFYQHGVNDPRDPVEESDTMVKSLRAKGIPVTYLRFADEGHSVTKLENRVIFYRELAAFLERHLASPEKEN